MKSRWINSIVVKFLIGFAAVILSTLVAFYFVYHRAYRMSQNITYEKLYSQTESYLQSFDSELSNVKLLQNDFFNDRKLSFIISPVMNINDYEKRDCLLSVRERIEAITGVSTLVRDGILYLPKSGYKIQPASVSLMKQSDTADMERYLQNADEGICMDESGFFIVKTGAPRIQKSSVPNHVFVIRFSRDAIVKNLSVINTSSRGGAFWYDEDEGVWVEHSNGKYAGERIVQLLETEETGEYRSIQRLGVDGEYYLVFVGGTGELGTFVQYEPESAAMVQVFDFRTLAIITLCALTAIALSIGIYTVLTLHKPINELMGGFRRVQNGNWKEHIEDRRKDEFGYLYRGFNDMEDRIDELINEVYVQTNLTQRAQMKQMQAQIAPHFLYNSFFVLSRRIKRQDYENAELLARHLGNYFQYLTRNEADYMPLHMEVEHARSYSAVQEARFSRRIGVCFEQMPQEMENIMIPRLILQPLMENAYKYGLEDKAKDGILWVHFGGNETEWLIGVEDNGENIPDEEIERLTGMLEHGKDGEITALTNIHKRLNIYYHGHSGLRIGRSELGGMAVTIYIGKENAVYEHESADC